MSSVWMRFMLDLFILFFWNCTNPSMQWQPWKQKHTHTQFVVLHLAGPLLLPNIDSCMSSSLANNIATSTVFNPSRNWLHRSTAKETKNHYLWQRKKLSFQTHFTIERPCSHIVHDIKNRSKDTCHERSPKIANHAMDGCEWWKSSVKMRFNLACNHNTC